MLKKEIQDLKDANDELIAENKDKKIENQMLRESKEEIVKLY